MGILFVVGLALGWVRLPSSNTDHKRIFIWDKRKPKATSAARAEG